MLKNNIIDYGPAIEQIAFALSTNDYVKARQIALSMPSRIKKERNKKTTPTRGKSKNDEARKYTEKDLYSIFLRDGFIDRYTGLRLVIPPSLRVISNLIPESFPFHSNWKEGKCHDAYWELSATADHIKPVVADGKDNPENLVSTSMAMNLQKNSIPLEQLGWKIHPAGTDKRWDGLSQFFVDQCTKHPEWLKIQYFRRWHQAIRDTLRK